MYEPSLGHRSGFPRSRFHRASQALPKQRQEVEPQLIRKARVQKSQDEVLQVASSRRDQWKIWTLLWNQRLEGQEADRYKSVTGKRGHGPGP